jgi:hypothetical protein
MGLGFGLEPRAWLFCFFSKSPSPIFLNKLPCPRPKFSNPTDIPTFKKIHRQLSLSFCGGHWLQAGAWNDVVDVIVNVLGSFDHFASKNGNFLEMQCSCYLVAWMVWAKIARFIDYFLSKILKNHSIEPMSSVVCHVCIRRRYYKPVSNLQHLRRARGWYWI